jgi:hypothetical protein
MNIVYCLRFETTSNLEGQVSVLISPMERVVEFYPQVLGSYYFASYDSQGYDGGIQNRLHTGLNYLV